MKKISDISFRGNGFVTLKDAHVPRLTEKAAAAMVCKKTGSKFNYVSGTPHLGYKIHLLQNDESLERDMKSAKKRLANKFNNH